MPKQSCVMFKWLGTIVFYNDKQMILIVKTMITITIATHKLNLPYIRLGFENRMIKQSTNMKKWPQNAGHLDNPAIQINAFGNPPKMIHQGLGTIPIRKLIKYNKALKGYWKFSRVETLMTVPLKSSYKPFKMGSNVSNSESLKNSSKKLGRDWVPPLLLPPKTSAELETSEKTNCSKGKYQIYPHYWETI